jgi:predicted O-methyltransferase YrrM
LKLPEVSLEEFLGQPTPAITFRYLAPAPVNTGPDDLVPLCTMAAAIKAQRILEVGCHLGCGAVNLALACPSARIVTYDIDYEAGAFIASAEPAVRDRIERRIVRFTDDSARLQAEPLFDFIFIDASHTGPAVSSDTNLALPRLAAGGVIAWHDYRHRGDEWVYGTNLVPEVLNELGTSLALRHLVGTTLAAWLKPA